MLGMGEPVRRSSVNTTLPPARRVRGTPSRRAIAKSTRTPSPRRLLTPLPLERHRAAVCSAPPRSVEIAAVLLLADSATNSAASSRPFDQRQATVASRWHDDGEAAPTEASLVWRPDVAAPPA